MTTLILLWLAFGALGAFTLMLCFLNDSDGGRLWLDTASSHWQFSLVFLPLILAGPFIALLACFVAFVAEEGSE